MSATLLMRKLTAILAVFSFLASSTGVTLAFHHHEAEADHCPDRCFFCQALTVHFSALAEGSTQVLPNVDAGRLGDAPIVTLPVVRLHFDPAAPRAPPAV